MLIDRVYSIVKTVMQKQNRGLLEPDSFNNAADYIQSKIINSLFDELNKYKNRAIAGYLPTNFFNKVTEIKAALTKLYVTENLVLDSSSGFFLYPDDFANEDTLMWGVKQVTEMTIMNYADAMNIEMMRNDDGEFIYYIKDSEGIITEPMLTDTDLQNAPLEMFYFRVQSQPKWAYAGTPPVFDEGNSIDFDLNSDYLDEIVRGILIYLGVEVKDFNLAQLMQGEENIQNQNSSAVQ